MPAEHLLIERAFRLTLSAPEMTVLVGGLRVAQRERRAVGLACSRSGRQTLTNDFFVNLLDMDTEWKPTSDAADAFEGRDRKKGERQVDCQPRRSGASDRTPSSARWRRSTRATTRRRNSCATSSRRGTR